MVGGSVLEVHAAASAPPGGHAAVHRHQLQAGAPHRGGAHQADGQGRHGGRLPRGGGVHDTRPRVVPQAAADQPGGEGARIRGFGRAARARGVPQEIS